MINIIKLDWLGMKCYWVRGILIPISIFLMGLISEILIIPYTAFYMLSYSVNPFAVEEKGKLDNLYLTLPVTRKTIVKARFGLSFIMQAAGLVMGIPVTLALSAVLYEKNVIFLHTFRADFDMMFLLIAGSLLFYAIMNLSIFPILFRVGYAKGKTLGFYIPIFGSTTIVYIVVMLYQFSETVRNGLNSVYEWSVANLVWASVIMLAAAALILALSYTLSYRLYQKREL